MTLKLSYALTLVDPDTLTMGHDWLLIAGWFLVGMALAVITMAVIDWTRP